MFLKLLSLVLFHIMYFKLTSYQKTYLVKKKYLLQYKKILSHINSLMLKNWLLEKKIIPAEKNIICVRAREKGGTLSVLVLEIQQQFINTYNCTVTFFFLIILFLYKLRSTIFGDFLPSEAEKILIQ